MILYYLRFIFIVGMTSGQKVHLYPYDQQENIEKCKNNLQQATEVTLKGYIKLTESTTGNDIMVTLDLKRFNTDTFKRYCSINLNGCNATELPSNCKFKLRSSDLRYDFIFNFTNQIIFSLAEARIRLLSKCSTCEGTASSIQQLPAIYTSLAYKLLINGNEINPNDCIFKINKDRPTVRFCCDAKQFPCRVSILLDDNELAKHSTCAEIEVNEQVELSTSSGFYFRYEICGNNQSTTMFQCQHIFVSSPSASSNETTYIFVSLILLLVTFIFLIVLNGGTQSGFRKKDNEKRYFCIYNVFEDTIKEPKLNHPETQPDKCFKKDYEPFSRMTTRATSRKQKVVSEAANEEKIDKQ